MMVRVVELSLLGRLLVRHANAVVIALLVSLAACGKSQPDVIRANDDGGVTGDVDGGTRGHSDPIEVDQLPERLAAAFCDQLGPCCAAKGIAHEALSCRASLLADARMHFGIPPDGVDYDPIAAGECVRAIEEAIRTCRATPSFRSGACLRMYIGHVEPGGSCETNRQCAHGASIGFCQAEYPSGNSTCVIGEERAALHAECAGTLTDNGNGTFGTGGSPACYTNDGLYCAETSRRCEQLPRLGDPCPQSYCADGTYCDPTGFCIPQRESGSCADPSERNACRGATSFCNDFSSDGFYECRPKLADGEPCGTAGHCASNFCAPGLPNERGSQSSSCGIATPDRCEGHIQERDWGGP
jgi:hypothetical protein